MEAVWIQLSERFWVQVAAVLNLLSRALKPRYLWRKDCKGWSCTVHNIAWFSIANWFQLRDVHVCGDGSGPWCWHVEHAANGHYFMSHVRCPIYLQFSILFVSGNLQSEALSCNAVVVLLVHFVMRALFGNHSLHWNQIPIVTTTMLEDSLRPW